MICFVCGQLCSGKTVYAKALSELTSSVFIEVGDIVRNIKQSEDRSILQDTKHLHSKIAEMLLCKYIETRPKQLIVSGVRQKEILEKFPLATLLWIDCPKNERQIRYNSRAREGDQIPFEEADRGDIELGILGVRTYILERTT